jgi:hypothetical protein
MSIRQAAREFGLARKTVRKMMQFSLPPGYERKKPVAKPKLGKRSVKACCISEAVKSGVVVPT